jgi:hypothetical protein
MYPEWQIGLSETRKQTIARRVVWGLMADADFRNILQFGQRNEL